MINSIFLGKANDATCLAVVNYRRQQIYEQGKVENKRTKISHRSIKVTNASFGLNMELASDLYPHAHPN